MIRPQLQCRRRATFSVVSGSLGLLALFTSCAALPEAGDYGKFRYVGRVRGAAPLRLLPPVADVAGNVYTLNGALDTPETRAFFTVAGGGESAFDSVTRGERYGAHGWVGFAQDRAWYWSGDALVAVSQTKAESLLEVDPGTQTRLLYRAIFPWVRDAPSRTSLVAMVQSASDPLPFLVRVDLNARIFTNITAFTPADASDVIVIGVGADREANLGYVLLQYTRDEQAVVEARFYDANATSTATASIRSGPLPEYGVLGYLQRSSRGLVVGLLSNDSLVAFDTAGGTILPIPAGMKAVGVHVWKGELFLVGTKDDRPVIAALDNQGQAGPPVVWKASEKAAAALGGVISVIDDRTLPSRGARWSPVKTAVGPFPFLSAHSLTQHAPDTTLWVVAGPTADFGGETQTAFAVAGVGVSYP